jgi:hypothetical protein
LLFLIRKPPKGRSATSDKTQGCPSDWGVISDRLIVLVAEAEAYATRCIRIFRNRQKEDVEVERTRKREAEEYETTYCRSSLPRRAKERRVAEDIGLTKHERELYGEEGVRFCLQLHNERAYLLLGQNCSRSLLFKGRIRRHLFSYRIRIISNLQKLINSNTVKYRPALR